MSESTKMATTRLGGAGISSSILQFGTMTLSCSGSNAMGMGVVGKEPSMELLDAAYAAGAFFIDTADAYSSGESEQVIGEWMAEKDIDRAGLVIATKVFFPTGPGPNDGGLSKSHILDGVAASLARLGTSYIDVLILHCFDYNVELEESLAAVNELIRRGSVRYFGVSNFAGYQLQRAVDICEARGYDRPVVAQHQYSLLVRSIEWEVLPVCRAHGIALMAWSPLASGWLTGRYTRDTEAPPEDSRVNWNKAIAFAGLDWETCANERTWGIVDALTAVAGELGDGVSLSQVALRWIVQRSVPGAPIIPIVGAKKMAHLTDNLAAANIELSDEQMARLNEASAIPVPYPYSFLAAFGGDFA